jgi:hypothetical protein
MLRGPSRLRACATGIITGAKNIACAQNSNNYCEI